MRLPRIPGVRLVLEPARHIEFSGAVADHALRRILRALNRAGQEFTFYDPLYPSPPDPHDPGSYFKYSPSARRKWRDVLGFGRPIWRMTLGNHGWSGGIYEIEERTICRQLQHLIARGLLKSIDLDRVYFSSHYAPEDRASNRRENAAILRAHSGN
jgi:hypothetical protein